MLPGKDEMSLIEHRDLLLCRIFAKASIASTDECWEWHGALKGAGYPHLKFQQKNYAVQTVMWELFIAAPRPGFDTDHLCRNRKCINPWHLEEVTHRVNMLRSNAPTGINARKLVCHRGHPFEAMEGTTRRCIRCRKFNYQQRVLRRQAS